MSYSLTRTSMALDQSTLLALDDLSKLWKISKAEVMRRAVRKLKEEAAREPVLLPPLDALEWLQKGGGLSPEEAETFRCEVNEERQAKRFWWET